MTRRKTKIEYNIGDWVKASASITTEYQPVSGQIKKGSDIFDSRPARFHKVISKAVESVCGQIVGGTYRKLGKFIPGYSGTDEPEQAQLDVTDTVFVYLVREGFLNKPREVLPEDITDHVPFDSLYLKTESKLPALKSRQPPFSDDCRKEMSEAAKQQPRVSGKFVKSK